MAVAPVAQRKGRQSVTFLSAAQLTDVVGHSSASHPSYSTLELELDSIDWGSLDPRRA